MMETMSMMTTVPTNARNQNAGMEFSTNNQNNVTMAIKIMKIFV